MAILYKVKKYNIPIYIIPIYNVFGILNLQLPTEEFSLHYKMICKKFKELD